MNCKCGARTHRGHRVKVDSGYPAHVYTGAYAEEPITYPTLYLTEHEATQIVLASTHDRRAEMGIVPGRGTSLARTAGNEWAYDAIAEYRRRQSVKA